MWKLRRELLRIRDQLLFPYALFFERNLVSLRLALWPGSRRVTEGAVDRGAKIAIYVAYQPDGIRPSAWETFRHLGEKGYSLIVVSHAPLTGDDRERLRTIAFSIIERPNVGYDFGAYQDAICSVILKDRAPSALLVMNDSIWFPATSGSDLIERMEDSGYDVCSPVLYVHRKSVRTHAQSYLVLYSNDAVASDAFRNFWHRYRAASNRTWTIRFGEMRMSDAMRRGGLLVGGLTEAYAIADSELQSFHEWQLRLQSAGLILEKRKAQETARGYLLSNHPRILLGSRQLGLLKKDRGAIFAFQRDYLLKSPDVSELRVTLTPTVAAEMAEHDLDRAGSSPPNAGRRNL